MLKSESVSVDYEKRLQKYYLQCFISEFSKILIFLFIFMVLHLTKEYFTALLFLMVLRAHGGGLHFNHYISCLFVSFSFLFTAIILAITVTPSRFFLCIAVLICILPGYLLVPITSTNRPEATPEQVKRSKRNTLYILSVIFIMMCICPLTTYIYIGFWTVLLHIFQLMIAYFIRR